jgi:hypothetical protein
MSQARRVARLMGLVPLMCVVASGCKSYSYTPAPSSFSGDSTAAKQTLVVPTLDTPAPKGKNVIWCATFQVCWDQMVQVAGKTDLPGSKDVIRRLNAARIDPAIMPKDRYYAAAGYVKGGIVAKIKSEMAARFPQAKPNLPPVGPGQPWEWLAYAYLNDAVKFQTAYFDQERGGDFTDSSGTKTHVTGFGLYDKSREADVNTTLGRQIDVLYSEKDKNSPREFVLDLDRNSKPSQLILACLEPKESLAATWQEVQRKITEWKPSQEEKAFGDHDRLAVPNLNYKIQHSFKELEIPGLTKTLQTIEFRLDRSGAAVASDADYAVAAIGRVFQFTRPFLIALRQRGSAEPYFVMWVDNAELLCKPSAR